MTTNDLTIENSSERQNILGVETARREFASVEFSVLASLI
jgi:hypothetical protein